VRSARTRGGKLGRESKPGGVAARVGADAMALEPDAEEDVHGRTGRALPREQLRCWVAQASKGPSLLVLVTQLPNKASQPGRQYKVMPVDGQTGDRAVFDHVVFG
jgi:hypothetical protein